MAVVGLPVGRTLFLPGLPRQRFAEVCLEEQSIAFMDNWVQLVVDTGQRWEMRPEFGAKLIISPIILSSGKLSSSRTL